MPLILTLRKGHDFFVEDERVVVSNILSGVEFVLRTSDGTLTTVDDSHWSVILPGVSVQAGIPRNQSGVAVRISIDAHGLKILRGELYRKMRPSKCQTCKGNGTLKQSVPSSKGTGFAVEEFPCPDC